MLLRPAILLALAIVPGLLALTFTDDNEICASMDPEVVAEPQVVKAPFKIVVDKGTYSSDRKKGNRDILVSIVADGKRMFRGFLLMARRVNQSLPEAQRKKPVGYFSQGDGTQIVCSNPNGNALTQTRGSPGYDQLKSQFTATWTATNMYGHIEFRATILIDDDTYWISEKSKMVFDPTKPIPEDTTEPPTDPFVLDLLPCGKTKGCYRYPPKCTEQNCEMLVTWQDKGEHVAFEMSGNSDGWIGAGLSEDKKMGKDDVLECVWNEQESIVKVQLSTNLEGKRTNTGITLLGVSKAEGYRSSGRIICRFYYQKEVNGIPRFAIDDNEYHILMARGPVDHEGNKYIHELEPGKYPYVSPSKVSLVGTDDITETARYPLVKVHACLMLLGWMMCCTTAILMAKYYKPMWPNDRLCNERIWFAVHRGCQATNLLCTVLGFILIFVHVRGYSWMPELPAKAHPPLGITTTILCILNPFIALCRCNSKSPRRPIFNWIHWFIGTCGIILATPTIFIGLNLPKAHVPWWATWVMVAYMLFHLIIELLLEIHGCMNSKKQKVRNMEFELRKKNDSRGDYYGLEPEPVGKRFKRIVLSIYLFVTIVLGLVMIITVAVG